LSRNESNISPLLAARVQPLRPVRDSVPARGGQHMPALRLSLHEEPFTEEATPNGDELSAGSEFAQPTSEIRHLPDAAAELARVADGLRAADAALGQINDRLRGLDKSLTDLFRQAARDPVTAATRFYTIINNTLAAIERIVADARWEGGRLLDGSCRLRFSRFAWNEQSHPSAGAEPHPADLALPTMAPSVLGHPEIGFLTSLRRVDLVLADATQQQLIAAIVLAAIRHVESERRRLAGYVETVVGPLVATLKVAMENVGASSAAQSDPAFADAVGRIRPLEILVERCSRRGRTRKSRAGGRVGLRIARP